MPGMNRTGPRGEGPMTGRGAGLCAGYGGPGSMRADFGWRAGGGRGAGRRFGAGGGRGWRHQYYATGVPGWARGYGPRYAFDPALHGGFGATPGGNAVRDEETAYLQEQARSLRASLEGIEARLVQLRQKPVSPSEPAHDSESGRSKQ
jgi:hypothetical protein